MNEELHPGAELQVAGDSAHAVFISSDDMGVNIKRAKGRAWIPAKQVKGVRWTCKRCLETWRVVSAALGGRAFEAAEHFTGRHDLCEASFEQISKALRKMNFETAADRLSDGLWVMDQVSR